MIKLENTEVYNIARAVYSARNAMNSWDSSDSDLEKDILGEADHTLAMKLSQAGSDHAKFRRMIPVCVDIVAPLYWWKEFDTYKVGTVANSCSTMHKIHSKEFTKEDFSIENLIEFSEIRINETIKSLNALRSIFVNWDSLGEALQKEFNEDRNLVWWQMIQLLPSSYNQRRTVFLNYEVLANIYKARRNHKLTEWHTFCEWIETLLYAEIITGGKKNA